jgi:hypothetical protein
MSILTRLVPSAALLPLVITAGCATSPSIEEFRAYLDDPKALRVAIQICLPDRTAFFEELRVDVTDLPANIPREELGKMFRDAQALKKYDNPYKSNRQPREIEIIQKWRAPVNNDYRHKVVQFGQAKNTKGVMSYGGTWADLIGSTYMDTPLMPSGQFMITQIG